MMSEARKLLQARLRRKFRYSTNTNYGRGAILWKDNELGRKKHLGAPDEIGICLANRTYGQDYPYQLTILTHNMGDRDTDAVAAFTKEEALLLCKIIEEFFKELEVES